MPCNRKHIMPPKYKPLRVTTPRTDRRCPYRLGQERLAVLGAEDDMKGVLGSDRGMEDPCALSGRTI